MKEIFIIVWAILSTGDMSYVNPTYEVTTIQEEWQLAKAIDNIEKKGWRMDIKLYRAKQIDYELTYTEEKEERIKKIPHLKLDLSQYQKECGE